MSHGTNEFPDSMSCTGPDSDPEYQDRGINELEDRRQGPCEEGGGTEQPKAGFAQNFQGEVQLESPLRSIPSISVTGRLDSQSTRGSRFSTLSNLM
jgi:hypothetical protein